MKNKFYEFSQNNSGGRFVADEKLCHRLFIEASSIEEAIRIAEGLGVYFGGVASGTDCECCGDRWSEPFDSIKFPVKWDNKLSFRTVEAYAKFLSKEYRWLNPVDVRIFYKNGKVNEY